MIVETIKHDSAPLAARIVADEDAESPRTAYDNAAVLILEHRRYDLGDTHDADLSNALVREEAEAEIRKAYGRDALIVPVYGYDHGGLTIRTGRDGNPFHCPWDSGLLGWAVMSRAMIRETYGVSRVTADVLQRANDLIDGEVETYDQYLRGEVYGYEIVRLDEHGEDTGEVIDACWGYYGSDEVEHEARSILDAWAKDPQPA